MRRASLRTGWRRVGPDFCEPTLACGTETSSALVVQMNSAASGMSQTDPIATCPIALSGSVDAFAKPKPS